MLPNNPLEVKEHIVRRKYLIIGLLLIIAMVGVVALFKAPSSPLQKISQKKPTVEIKTTYKNPFEKKTQYVNPFDKYKNPFVVNR